MASLLATFVRVLASLTRSAQLTESCHRISIWCYSLTLTVTSTRGRQTGFGEAHLYGRNMCGMLRLDFGHRYKNRQVVGPNAKCVGIDMNRFVISKFLERCRRT